MVSQRHLIRQELPNNRQSPSSRETSVGWQGGCRCDGREGSMAIDRTYSILRFADAVLRFQLYPPLQAVRPAGSSGLTQPSRNPKSSQTEKSANCRNHRCGQRHREDAKTNHPSQGNVSPADLQGESLATLFKTDKECQRHARSIQTPRREHHDW